ncbi:hypothetical protein ACYRFS_05740 [Listeria kieliensis]
MKLEYVRVSIVGQDLKTQIEKLKAEGIQDDYLFIEKIWNDDLKSGRARKNY